MDYTQLLTTLSSQLASVAKPTGELPNRHESSQSQSHEEEDDLMNKIGLAIQREGGTQC